MTVTEKTLAELWLPLKLESSTIDPTLGAALRDLLRTIDHLRDEVEVLTERLADARKQKQVDPPCSGPGYAHEAHGNCPGYGTDRT